MPWKAKCTHCVTNVGVMSGERVRVEQQLLGSPGVQGALRATRHAAPPHGAHCSPGHAPR